MEGRLRVSFEKIHFLMGQHGLEIINAGRKLISDDIVKVNGYEHLMLASDSH